MTGILFALVPTLMWGFLPVVVTKLGGKPKSQLMGTSLGALIFALCTFVFAHTQLTIFTAVISFISGVFWSFGQMNQYIALMKIGVSKTMPISTGMQLVGVALFGVIVFHEWSTVAKIALGVTAILLIIIGIFLTTYRENTDAGDKDHPLKGMLNLLFSAVGYMGYIVILRYFNINGWTAVLPQSLGMFIGGILISGRGDTFNRYTGRNIIPGLMWAIGNLGLLIATPLVGVATSFSFSQMGIVISTLGGILILKERKSRKQMIFVVIGCLLVVIGGICIGLTRR
ncbi:glucose transporter GlcU [Sporolactobacillus sp. THM7-4]|nr:glucose transporter GlcU [Sporolactobacillus sp. THM7-4]